MHRLSLAKLDSARKQDKKIIFDPFNQVIIKVLFYVHYFPYRVLKLLVYF